MKPEIPTLVELIVSGGGGTTEKAYKSLRIWTRNSGCSRSRTTLGGLKTVPVRALGCGNRREGVSERPSACSGFRADPENSGRAKGWLGESLRPPKPHHYPYSW